MKTDLSLRMPPSTLAVKRALFPLAAPRYQTLAFWPLHVMAAAIDGYHAAFFAVLDGAPL